MQINRGPFIGILIASAAVGAIAIIVSTFVNHATSTDAFCSTSCHSMVIQSSNDYFQRSKHRNNSKGVIATCADCHIPTTNWFVETYTHVSSGMRDVFMEMTHNFKDPKNWEAHRAELTPEVQAKLRRQDSVTCRSCHDANAISPASESGKTSHAMLKQGGVTCVDCHANIVHPPAQKTSGMDLSPSNFTAVGEN
jgi:nitrate/TMAO reductase-like tetraheme cytochrome c subunit